MSLTCNTDADGSEGRIREALAGQSLPGRHLGVLSKVNIQY
jgi:hypothetical protein